MSVKAPIEFEKDLLLRLRDGDHAAFHSLYNTYKFDIARKLLFLLKDEDLAQDTLQELFIKIWDMRQNIKPDQSFPAFLHTVARNMVIDIFRKATREQRVREQLLAESTDRTPSLEDKIIAEETLAQLQQALQQLPERQREVFVLHKIEGKSYREIGELLSIGEDAIGKHVYRAKQTLTRLLIPKLPPLIALVILSM